MTLQSRFRAAPTSLKTSLGVARQGSWTLLANLGTKTYMLTLTVCAGYVDGPRGVGVTATLLGSATVAAGLADFGFAAETARTLSVSRHRAALNSLMRSLFPRTLFAIIVGALVGFFAHIHAPLAAILVALPLMTVAMVVQGFMSCCLFAFEQYKESSGIVLVARTVGAVVMIVISTFSHNLHLLVVCMVLTEVLTALLLVVRVAQASRHLAPTGPLDRRGKTYMWLGVGGLVNTLINKSDVVLISAVVGSATTGVYSVASQVQNAVTTVALSASASLPQHVARDAQRNPGALKGVTVMAKVVFVLTSVLAVSAVGVFFVVKAYAPQEVAEYKGLLPTLLLCMLAAPFSSAGGCLMSAAIGTGEYRVVGIGWLITAACIIPTILLGAGIGGAQGSAAGAIIRDVVFLTVAAQAWNRVQRRGSRNPSAEEAVLC